MPAQRSERPRSERLINGFFDGTTSGLSLWTANEFGQRVINIIGEAKLLNEESGRLGDVGKYVEALAINAQIEKMLFQIDVLNISLPILVGLSLIATGFLAYNSIQFFRNK